MNLATLPLLASSPRSSLFICNYQHSSLSVAALLLCFSYRRATLCGILEKHRRLRRRRPTGGREEPSGSGRLIGDPIRAGKRLVGRPPAAYWGVFVGGSVWCPNLSSSGTPSARTKSPSNPHHAHPPSKRRLDGTSMGDSSPSKTRSKPSGDGNCTAPGSWVRPDLEVKNGCGQSAVTGGDELSQC